MAKELTEAQVKSALAANRAGFITHVLACGKTEGDAVKMFKRASARNERREKLANTIRENLKSEAPAAK